MSVEKLGCPYCGERVEISLTGDEQVTEIKKERSFFDGLLALRGVTVGSVECPNDHSFYAHVE